jgi:hypothetical protein
VAPLVVVVIVAVLVTLATVGAVVGISVRLLGRHWSRTRDQESTVHAVQMALFAMVQASRQRVDAARGNGQWTRRPAPDAPWMAADARARATVLRQLPLVEDDELTQLTRELLEQSRRLLATSDADTGVRLGGEVEALYRRFGARCTAVVRELALRRVYRRR